VRVAFAVDHAGFELRHVVSSHLVERGHEVLDLGAHVLDEDDDYPDFAEAVGTTLREGQAARGLIICGSGVGAAIAANKLTGIRAGLCHDHYTAHQGVEHDDMNVLCLGARVIGSAVALEIIDAFLGARFSERPRHQRRLEKIRSLEARFRRA
jgi:ribose 5-phosphate isomerase B